jgi:hypothetical protein
MELNQLTHLEVAIHLLRYSSADTRSTQHDCAYLTQHDCAYLPAPVAHSREVTLERKLSRSLPSDHDKHGSHPAAHASTGALHGLFRLFPHAIPVVGVRSPMADVHVAAQPRISLLSQNASHTPSLHPVCESGRGEGGGVGLGGDGGGTPGSRKLGNSVDVRQFLSHSFSCVAVPLAPSGNLVTNSIIPCA